MKDTFDIGRVTAAMSAALVRELGDEVELVIHYGSTVRGNAGAASDVDLCWVPAHEDSWQSVTIEVDDTLVDLFAVHWSRLEAMAELRDPFGTILEQRRVLYAKDPAARERLDALTARLASMREAGRRKELLERAFGIFRTAGYPLYQLRRSAARGELLGALHAAVTLDETLSHCLLALNQKSVDTRKDADMATLEKLPKDYFTLRRRLVISRAPAEIEEAAGALMESVREALASEQREVCAEPADFKAIAGEGGIAEHNNDFRHAARAASTGDIRELTRSLSKALWELRYHVGQAYSGRWFDAMNSLDELTAELPGLRVGPLGDALVKADAAACERECERLIADLKALYASRACPTNCFDDVDELEAWLGELKL